MGGVAMFFTRILAQAFPGGARVSTADPPSTSRQAERTVGTGASNETFVTIDGIAHLFVDEGDCVVEFVPAFDDAPGDTMFGTKILPALAPHWAVAHEYSASLKDAIAAAIRRESVPASPALNTASAPDAADLPTLQPADVPKAPSHDEDDGRGLSPTPQSSRTQYQRGRRDDSSRSSVVEGSITGWGEETFPDRRPGKSRSYRSFALRLKTRDGEQVLQGEGLKEAINKCGCSVGDIVSVKRLRKIKVPAFRKEDGSPIYKDGQQVMWDKWLWSITK
ncbi:hypothetical protein DN523_27380 [Burkholderia multivorans]|uniref:hypothetical protein n=1 Tax=Burkholderia multivorans TaxID=87883 RepID=UPI0006669F4B|nr:hypothetical protein [Burkholderia multivorans]MBR8122497.1 hypothetical protein [Burkholderia multivorans]MBU9164402.1 hypothetical protein [Burkholderia multivorans]MBU9446079.1 hypothetical protein [Burkholderia multivorans]MBU9450778.1 hypothetical protein [Burkholderia multivorans]MBU9521449.1 hypothetical protein [Burkholderia multivorans]